MDSNNNKKLIKNNVILEKKAQLMLTNNEYSVGNYKMNIKDGIKLMISSSLISNKKLNNISPLLLHQFPTALSTSMISLMDKNLFKPEYSILSTPDNNDNNDDFSNKNKQLKSIKNLMNSNENVANFSSKKDIDLNSSNNLLNDETCDYLEVPRQERLLPIGFPNVIDKSVNALDKVNQILGISVGMNYTIAFVFV